MLFYGQLAASKRAIAISTWSIFEGGCLAVTINLIVYLLLFDPDSFQEPRRRLNESKSSEMGLILQSKK
jgi:hypothetical protein